MKIPNWCLALAGISVSLARIVSEDSQPSGGLIPGRDKSSKDS